MSFLFTRFLFAFFGCNRVQLQVNGNKNVLTTYSRKRNRCWIELPHLWIFLEWSSLRTLRFSYFLQLTRPLHVQEACRVYIWMSRTTFWPVNQTCIITSFSFKFNVYTVEEKSTGGPGKWQSSGEVWQSTWVCRWLCCTPFKQLKSGSPSATIKKFYKSATVLFEPLREADEWLNKSELEVQRSLWNVNLKLSVGLKYLVVL